jgi:hypothetical protein
MELDYTPFNKWQMPNCASCCIPSPCEKRAEIITNFEKLGSTALKECPDKVPL